MIKNVTNCCSESYWINFDALKSPLSHKSRDSAMTLILSRVTHDFAVQVADRLLSYPGGSPFDKRSNKTVIFRARDAIVVAAYTGDGFVDRLPTDQWIATVLSDDPDVAKSDYAFRIGGGRLGRTWPQR